jgi:hypothetical protein
VVKGIRNTVRAPATNHGVASAALRIIARGPIDERIVSAILAHGWGPLVLFPEIHAA